MCELYFLAGKLLQIYSFVMLAYAVVSWVPSLRGKWTDYVAMAVEPVLSPVRRIIPPIAGLDVAFIIVFLVIQLAANQALNTANTCY
jgi:YggT family protein